MSDTSALFPHPMEPPASANIIWVASIASLLVSVGLFVIGQGSLLRMVIPVGCTIVGLCFYFYRPVAYFHFVLWTWFLIPLVRRVVDWRVGFADHNLILLAPFLVSAIAGITLLREHRRATPEKLAPFYLCIGGVLYAFTVGLVRWRLHSSEGISLGEIAFGLIDWLAPILFGLHLYLRGEMFEDHRRATRASLSWAVLLLGAYGIYQFMAPPIWDRVWLEHMLADVDVLSFGRPETFQVRVWSTLNSPAVFGNILVAGLLLQFSGKSRLRIVTDAVGYSAFILTLVRACWLGWLVGFVILAKISKGGQIPRLLCSFLLLPVLVAPLMLNPQIADIVTQRVQTLQDTGQDVSLQERAEEYRIFIARVATDPFGQGLNNAKLYTIDSGLLQLFYEAGWLGSALFMAGVFLCARRMHFGRATADPFASFTQAAFAAMIFVALSGNTFVGASGLILWISIGLNFSLHETEQVSLRLPRQGFVSFSENQAIRTLGLR